ncbi:hypothetical protein [Dactylosporangium sp. NPDC048998]|uniref:hypothetical protein n=1 Tax=Dactylosporangium sp. NPDC048998 TaxID=3363976 RepID=UPI0037245855
MVTPDEVERRFTLLTAAARFDEPRRRDALAPPGSEDPYPQAVPLSRDEALELLACAG